MDNEVEQMLGAEIRKRMRKFCDRHPTWGDTIFSDAEAVIGKIKQKELERLLNQYVDENGDYKGD